MDFVKLIQSSQNPEELKENFKSQIKSKREQLSYDTEDIDLCLHVTDPNSLLKYNQDRLLYQKINKKGDIVRRKVFGEGHKRDIEDSQQ